MTLTEEQRGTVGFDLEKARAADEALPYPLDANEIWVSGKGQMHINPPNAPSIFFTLSDLCEFRNLFHGQAAEIERLRAETEEAQESLTAAYLLGSHKKAQEMAARIKELEGMLSIRTEELDIAHSVARSEKEMHEKELAAFARRIKELEDAHKRSGKKYAKIINELRSSVYANIPGLDVGKIGPDADAKPREGLYGKYRIAKVDGSPVDPNADYFVMRLDTDPVARRAAREYSYMTPDRDLALGLQNRIAQYDPAMRDCINLRFFGMEKPKVWQITKEEKRALSIILEYISYDADDDIEICSHAAVLRAMLREAE